jgi:hypothetical protein
MLQNIKGIEAEGPEEQVRTWKSICLDKLRETMKKDRRMKKEK